MSDLLTQYNALPRAARWLVMFAGVFALFLAANHWIFAATDRYRERADRAEASLRREQSLAADWSNTNRPLAAARDAFGAPSLPATAVQGAEALYKRVTQILESHHIRAELSQKQATLPAESTAPLLQPGEQRLDRFILDLSFEADPQTVIAVLTDLEGSDEIAAVSRVSVRKVDAGPRAGAGRSDSGGSSRTVRAEISTETWVRVVPNVSGGSR